MRIFKRIYSAVTTLVIALVVILAVLLAGVRLFGITPYTVLSGSMEPNYHVGSLIYVVKVDPAELCERDPVTYTMSDGTVVTHRIIEVITDDPSGKLLFRTQGDANETPDGERLTEDRIIGKPIFTIPLLGYFAYFVQNPPGTYFAIALCFALLIAGYVPDLLAKGAEMTAEGKAGADGAQGDSTACHAVPPDGLYSASGQNGRDSAVEPAEQNESTPQSDADAPQSGQDDPDG